MIVIVTVIMLDVLLDVGYKRCIFGRRPRGPGAGSLIWGVYYNIYIYIEREREIDIETHIYIYIYIYNTYNAYTIRMYIHIHVCMCIYA